MLTKPTCQDIWGMKPAQSEGLLEMVGNAGPSCPSVQEKNSAFRQGAVTFLTNFSCKLEFAFS